MALSVGFGRINKAKTIRSSHAQSEIEIPFTVESSIYRRPQSHYSRSHHHPTPGLPLLSIRSPRTFFAIMQFSIKLLVGLFALHHATALGSAADSLKEISSATDRMERAISGWGGSSFTSIPLLVRAGTLLDLVDNKSNEFAAMSKSSKTDETEIIPAAKDMAKAVERISNTLTDAKDKYKRGLPFGEDIMYAIIRRMAISSDKAMQGLIDGTSSSSGGDLKTAKEAIASHLKRAQDSFQ